MQEINIESLLAIVLSGLALMVLWVFYFWFYWQYRVDNTRQELFFLRNELFDYAAEGHISFNHPAYGILRGGMNSIIRFTHRMELVTLLILYYAVKISPPPGDDFTISFKNALNTEISDEAKKKLEEFYDRMNIVVAMHCIKSSIPMMLLIPVLGALILIYEEWRIVLKGFDNLKYEIKRRLPVITQIDNIAAKLG